MKYDCFAACPASRGLPAPMLYATSTVVAVLTAKKVEMPTIINWLPTPTPASASAPSRETIAVVAICTRDWSRFSTMDGQARRSTAARSIFGVSCSGITPPKRRGGRGVGALSAGLAGPSGNARSSRIAAGSALVDMRAMVPSGCGGRCDGRAPPKSIVRGYYRREPTVNVSTRSTHGTNHSSAGVPRDARSSR